MTTKTEIHVIDVNTLRTLSGDQSLLSGVPEQAIPAILAETLTWLAAHPESRRQEVPALVHKLWEAVRAIRYDGRNTVEHALGNNPLYTLEGLLLALLNAGDLRATLTRQRDALTAQLAKLDGLQPATTKAGAR